MTGNLAIPTVGAVNVTPKSLADPREDATIVTVGRTREDQLLPGEWACLGILYPAPAHGFAIATRLKPDGDVGRVWSLSRALTYRSLDQLELRGHIKAVGEEPGIAELCSIDVTEMLMLQRQLLVEMRAALEAQVALDRADVVALWRSESTDAALRFLDRLTEARHRGSSRVRSARR